MLALRTQAQTMATSDQTPRRPELVALLREMTGVLKGEPEAESFRFSLLESAGAEAEGYAGVPRGALIEMSGAAGGGKTEALLRLVSENPETRVAWVEERFTIFPSALPQHGVSLDRILFVEGKGANAIWVVHQLLRSQMFAIVVLGVGPGLLHDLRSDVVLRRLQLAAGKARATVVFLAESSLQGAPWPISVQIQVRRSTDNGEPVLNILKYRGNRLWKVSR
jgi:hypothetical protein